MLIKVHTSNGGLVICKAYHSKSCQPELVEGDLELSIQMASTSSA